MRAIDLIAAAGGAALVTLLGRWVGANATTVGFVYLLLVLALAARRGLVAGLSASVVSTLCYNYFFFPPFGTFTISAPANWVALAAFLGTAVVVSRLVDQAHRRATEAQERERETQILYDLSFALFTTTSRLGSVGDATATCLRTIGAREGGLVLFRDGRPALVGWIGERAIDLDHPALAGVAERREVLVTDVDGEPTTFLPLQAGETVRGVLVAMGTEERAAVLESAGRLMALAVERERLLEERAQLEALRASDRLKTSLLRAVSHDLRTPLTAMRLETEQLARKVGDRHDLAATIASLSEEEERLTRRIDELLAMARLEAGVVVPHPEPTPASGLFTRARAALTAMLRGREVEVSVGADCPEVYADPALTLEIVVNLLENAARASPPDQPLELAASRDPVDPTRVRIEIRDRGPGVAPAVRAAVLDPRAGPLRSEPGDAPRIGLGLDIAAGLARASGGTVDLLPRSGGGTVARLELPAALAAAPASGA
jgi:two-component system sensor histidine kinase KdpD